MGSSKKIIVFTLIICILTGMVISPLQVLAATRHETIVNNACYYILNLTARKSLDVTNESTANGARLQMWTKYDNHQNQVFRLEYTESGWIIRAWNSGKVLDVSNGSKTNGAAVIQWDCHYSSNQKWDIVYNSDGSVSFKNRCSGKYLDIEGASTRDGAKMIQYTSNGGWNQKFRLIRIYSDRVLSASWEWKWTDSNISWWNKSMLNQTRFVKSGNKSRTISPTPDKPYLVKVDYIDPQTVFYMTRTKSFDKSTLQQIKDIVYGEGKEEAAAFLLKKLIKYEGFGIGIAIGCLEILLNRNNSTEWNRFVSVTAANSSGRVTGVIKKTYVTPTYEYYKQNFTVSEKVSYVYSTWSGDNFNGSAVPNYLSGFWKLNFK